MADWWQHQIDFHTTGRGCVEVTSRVNAVVAESELKTGLAHLFLQHTSASLILCENADPTVLSDMETIFQDLAPDGDRRYRHNYEGDDDMAAHIRTVLTGNDLSIPIQHGQLGLGRWQGVYLYEHRYQPHHRTIVITLQGE